MKKEQISNSQLFSLIILFEIGSTTLFALGIDAKQDAWIAVLIALVIGFGLLWIFTEIIREFPDKNLAEIIIEVLGKSLGAPLIILYALSFFWTSAFNFYEFSESIVEYFLDDTPLAIILLFVLIVFVYGILLGIEVIGRSAEIFLPWFLFFIISIYVFVVISGATKFQQLLPVMEYGMMPILKTTPQIVNFPFGEMNVFLMYWCYVNNKQIIRKTSFIAVGISGILLMISIVSMITVIGVYLTSTSAFPLFKVIGQINIGNVIQRIDAIAGVILFTGGFYKGTLYFNGSRLLIQSLFKPNKKHQQWLVILMSLCLFIYINYYFTEFNFYRWAGLEINTKIVYPIFQVSIPILLLLIIKVKAKFSEVYK